MGWVEQSYSHDRGTSDWTYKLKLKPYASDLSAWRIKKTRVASRCIICKKQHNKQSYMFGGSGWGNLCLKCGKEFAVTSMKGLFEVITTIKSQLKELEKNKEKYDAENVLASL